MLEWNFDPLVNHIFIHTKQNKIIAAVFFVFLFFIQRWFCATKDHFMRIHTILEYISHLIITYFFSAVAQVFKLIYQTHTYASAAAAALLL